MLVAGLLGIGAIMTYNPHRQAAMVRLRFCSSISQMCMYSFKLLNKCIDVTMGGSHGWDAKPNIEWASIFLTNFETEENWELTIWLRIHFKCITHTI